MENVQISKSPAKVQLKTPSIHVGVLCNLLGVSSDDFYVSKKVGFFWKLFFWVEKNFLEIFIIFSDFFGNLFRTSLRELLPELHDPRPYDLK